MSFKELCVALETEIQDSYMDGVSAEKAERLAGQFIHAQLKVSSELKKADLDARMKKSGLKAIRASAYMAAASSGEKKPTEAAIAAIIDTDSTVSMAQDLLDNAEVLRDDLDRYYNIFQNAHIHFRSIAKGSFGG